MPWPEDASTTNPGAYFLDVIRKGLKDAGRLDGLHLQLHGACAAVGLDDVEGEQAELCREILGPDVPILLGLDHHANVTERMVRCRRRDRRAPHPAARSLRHRSDRRRAAAPHDQGKPPAGDRDAQDPPGDPSGEVPDGARPDEGVVRPRPRHGDRPARAPGRTVPDAALARRQRRRLDRGRGDERRPRPGGAPRRRTRRPRLVVAARLHGARGARCRRGRPDRGRGAQGRRRPQRHRRHRVRRVGGRQQCPARGPCCGRGSAARP